MKIVPFEIDHFDAMAIKEACHVKREYRNIYEVYCDNGPAFTLMDSNNSPLACGGIVILRQGVGEIWMLSSNGINQHPVSVGRVGKYVIEEAEKLQLHRIQATVEYGDIAGKNYVEAFGFNFEGLMRKYGPDGQDFLLYARVK